MASKGSQSLLCVTAVNRGALSCDSREVQKCRIHSSERTAELAWHFFYMYLIEQLQPLPYVFLRMMHKLFWKIKLDHHLGYFLAYSIVVGCQGKFCPLEWLTQVQHRQQCSNNMFTASTSSGFAIRLCTKNIA